MKKFIISILVAGSFALLSGCSTKFNIAAPYKNITVVYGLLDEADTNHYVRIEKAFLSGTLNSLTMAQSADSSFFPQLNVRIKRYDFSGNYYDSIILTKVDLDTVAGYHKVPGVFFTTPNYAYTFNNALNPNLIYTIFVTNPATGETDSASAPVIDDPVVSDNTFVVTDIDDSFANRGGLDFASTVGDKSVSLGGWYTPPANFSFEGLSNPAYICQLVVRFRWSDSNIVAKTVIPDSFDYNVGYQQIVDNNFAYYVSNISFYGAIADGIGTAPANVFRLIDRCRLLVYMSTIEYDNCYENSLVLGTGLTGNEIEPTYTNIQGANTLGIFTSKGVRSALINITADAIDSLENSSLTANTRIVGTVYH